MKKIILSTLVLAMSLTVVGCNGCKSNHNNDSPLSETPIIDDNSKETRIQVAILLDTSSSMDGLIEQAKSRLWNIVNTLTTLKYKGKTPMIEIAIYEYGNNGLSAESNYIRQVTSLTTDLDLISGKLFALTTNGGYEYCGAVIDKAVKALEWGTNQADMKLIYIAGNEPFTQGSIDYRAAIRNALEHNIYVNTIHCGDSREGIEGMWKDGAIKGKGKYFNIDHNARVRHYDTPYDDQISECNIKLNETYISYGSMGRSKKESQIKQDENAKSISSANYAERAVSKIKNIYKNTSWDLVDKVKEDKNALDQIDNKELPQELQHKSKEELKVIVAEQATKRADLQKEIGILAQKRQAYIDETMKNDIKNTDEDLGKAINQSILDLALIKGYEIEKK